MDKFKSRAVCAAATVFASAAFAPVMAFAEEEKRSGIMLLIPTPAEFIPAIIAFVIIFFVLSKLAWPKVIAATTAREEKIQSDLDSAREVKEKAEADAKSREELLADAQREAGEIIAQARRDADEERNKILAKAQKDASATISKAHDAVAAERRKAMVQLSVSVVDLSVEIAGKIIGNDLSDDEHRALAEKYLVEVGNSYDA